jgi:hypothetical protein
MSKKNRSIEKVQSDFTTYQDLLKGGKSTTGGDIRILDVRANNSLYYSHETPIIHSAQPHNMKLVTEVKTDNYKEFKFKIFAPSFIGPPLINYDSDGPSHDNSPGKKLTARAVDTPHFNCYDSFGKRIAYKTAALQDPVQCKSFEDPSVCIIHFYTECNIKHTPAGFPAVLVRPDLLPLPVESFDDPNEHATYFD